MKQKKLSRFISSITNGLGSSDVQDVEGKILSYCEFFDIPESLFAIGNTVKESRDVIEVLKTIGDSRSRALLEGWEYACNFILENVHILSEMGIKYEITQHRGKNVRGCIDSNPLSAFMRCVAFDPELDDPYTHLKAHMHIAWPSLIDEVNHWFLEVTGREIRRLGNEELSDVLSRLTTEPMSQSSYIDHLEKLYRSDEVCKGNERLLKVLRAFRVSEGVEEITTRLSSGGGHGDGGGEIIGVLPRDHLLMPGGINFNEVGGEHESILVLPRNTDTDYRASFEAIIDHLDSDDFRDVDLKLEALAAKGKKDAISISNQNLRTSINNMSIYEMSVLVNAIYKGLSDAASQTNMRELYIWVMLSLMFVYSRTLEQCSGINIHKELPRTLNKNCDIAYCKSTNEMLIRPLGVGRKIRLNDRQKEQSVAVEAYIRAPVPRIVSDYIKKLVDGKVFGSNKSPHIYDMPAVKLAAQEYLKEINNSKNVNIGLSKVQRYIYNAMCNMSGVSDAAVFTTVRDCSLASQIHYYLRSQASLLQIHAEGFNQAIQYADNECGMSGLLIRDLSICETTGSEGYIGNRGVPTIATYRELFRELIERLTIFCSKNTNRIISYHNVYVAYTTLLLDICTGQRAVNYKYFFAKDIRLDIQAIYLNEKDIGDYFNTRIVPIPEVACSHIEYFFEYRKWIVSRISRISPSSYALLMDPETQKIPARTRNQVISHKEGNLGMMLFLDEHGRPLKNEKRLLKEIFGDLLVLKEDSNRHYLRWRLIEHGLDGEIIDAVLGHSRPGQEPDGKYSSISLSMDILNIVRPVQQEILQELGAIAIDGKSLWMS